MLSNWCKTDATKLHAFAHLQTFPSHKDYVHWSTLAAISGVWLARVSAGVVGTISEHGCLRYADEGLGLDQTQKQVCSTSNTSCWVLPTFVSECQIWIDSWLFVFSVVGSVADFERSVECSVLRYGMCMYIRVELNTYLHTLRTVKLKHRGMYERNRSMFKSISGYTKYKAWQHGWLPFH